MMPGPSYRSRNAPMKIYTLDEYEQRHPDHIRSVGYAPFAPNRVKSERHSKSRRQKHHSTSSDEEENGHKPRIIDVIGRGQELTVCGHINLLRLLPLHHPMHRELLETFRKKPGNYEGKYQEQDSSTAYVLNYGKGYLAIHFTDDITRPELSEFLLAKKWKMLNAHCAINKGKTMIYEKWTNILERQPRARQNPEVHYMTSYPY